MGSRDLDFEALAESIANIVLRHYPRAVIGQISPGRIGFHANTRRFMIHVRDKAGNWQNAVPVTGPNALGIVGTVSLRDGRWQGAAELPQAFSHFYFTEYVDAIDSQTGDAHLHISVRYPEPYPTDFMSELMTALKSFD